jgi:rubrerythrin
MDTDSMADEGLVAKLRNTDLSSRRAFLQRSAAAGAGALALAIGSSNAALAHEGTDDDFTDIEVLNFALTLEHLEYAFYRDGLKQFDEDDFMQAEVLSGFGSTIREGVRPKLSDIRDHEGTHVVALTDTVESLGGTPAEEACYDFGYNSPSEFLGVASVLENTGVSAYDGAISLIEQEELLTTGATIATVEARHASYVNLLTDKSPFPGSFDDPLSPGEVLDAAGGFIVDCESTGPPALPGQENPPKDVDNDGVYEDLNGDGEFTFSDIQLYYGEVYRKRDSEFVQNNLEFFDVDGDGKITLADVQALFDKQSDSGGSLGALLNGQN